MANPVDPLGITLNLQDGQSPVPVFQDDAGLDTFETDAPYLLSDAMSLEAPIPVVVNDGPVWLDPAGNPFNALAVKTVPGGSGLVKGPLDIIDDTTDNDTIGGTFDLATPSMTLAVVTAYVGEFASINATHGGEPLTLVREDHAGGIVTAVFYGNGMTMESAELVVSAPGVKLGPSVMRMRDDWEMGAIASDWNDGKAVADAVGTGWVNVGNAGLPEPREILYAHGSKGIAGSNNMNTTTGMVLALGLRGSVITGDLAEWNEIGQITTGWRQEGDEFIHNITAPSPLMLWFNPIEGDFAAKFVYTAVKSFTARMRESGADNTLQITMAPGERVTGYLFKKSEGGNRKGISFIVSGDVTIHSVQSIANPYGIHANIGASAGPTDKGMLQGVTSPAAAQTLTMFCIHGAANG